MAALLHSRIAVCLMPHWQTLARFAVPLEHQSLVVVFCVLQLAYMHTPFGSSSHTPRD